MALVPYKNSENNSNRSRSSSCSSPVRNRIVCQQIFSIGSNTLVRSYSCDQVFHKDDSGRTFQTTQLQFTSFVTPEKKNYIKKVTKPHKKNLASEYKEELRTKSGGLLSKMLILTLTTAVISSGLYFYYKTKECLLVWDVEKTGSELQENVFGQDIALIRIQNILSYANNYNNLNIMVFTGGVGVGKTLTSSIISKNFPWSTNLILPNYKYSSNPPNIKLQTCGCNLIIIDDLTKETVDKAVDFLQAVENSRKNKENILVILIFKSPDEETTKNIVSKLKLFHIDHIPFQSLTEKNVRDCFKFEMKRQNVLISNAKVEELVKEQMKIVDVINGPAGCKGVAEEVSAFYNRA